MLDLSGDRRVLIPVAWLLDYREKVVSRINPELCETGLKESTLRTATPKRLSTFGASSMEMR